MLFFIIKIDPKKVWVLSPFSRGFQHTKICIIWILYNKLWIFEVSVIAFPKM
jgi:hypothetical protein